MSSKVATSLAPGLLLAAPQLGDPHFERTVVMLARHDADGALGWVINGRALGTIGFLLSSSKLVPEGVKVAGVAKYERAARVGGPVSPSTGWLVYRRLPEPLAGELSVGEELAITGDAEGLRHAMREDLFDDFRLWIGYAGWGPGQLENELRAGAWLPADVDASLLFDTHPDDVWDEAYRRTIGANPAAFNSRRGGSA